MLRAAVEHSIKRQKLWLEDDNIAVEAEKNRAGKVFVSGKGALEAAEPYAKAGKKVCVLNFASATNPGGGVVHGSFAQEESICRCSTLYPCLNIDALWAGFYEPHREANVPLYNDDCIFTPDVKVFKSDTGYPKRLEESEWWNVDIITSAAPNLRDMLSNAMNPDAGSAKANISIGELEKLLNSRIQRIFEVALAGGAEVLVLGAFGCRAFKNPPQIVAKIFSEYTAKYREFFEVIEYAVFHVKSERPNYEAFKENMQRFI